MIKNEKLMGTRIIEIYIVVRILFLEDVGKKLYKNLNQLHWSLNLSFFEKHMSSRNWIKFAKLHFF